MSKTKKKELNNVVGYIISKQKSVAFLYTVNEYMHIEIENTVPFIKIVLFRCKSDKIYMTYMIETTQC